MSKYKGLFTFDVDNHRYLPVEQADGIIDCMNYHPELEMPKEPLIKDEKIRKAVRAWAEANDIDSCFYGDKKVKFNSSEHRFTWIDTSIEFDEIIGLENLKNRKGYTIAELCGEEEE